VLTNPFAAYQAQAAHRLLVWEADSARTKAKHVKTGGSETNQSCITAICMYMCMQVTLQCVPRVKLVERTFTASVSEVKKNHAK
jgi:hypothetical protein